MKRILVVDDKEENQYLLSALFAGNGFAVELAMHGAEALEKARQHPPDLVIADILMPVMDGFTLCREWQQDERLRPLPFIFYTATYTSERDREFALGLGATRFLIKPEEPDNLLAIVHEVLGQDRRPAAPVPGAPMRLPIEAPVEQEAVYLKQYNQVLVHKLEAKMEQLEQANRELERDVAGRRLAEAKLREAETRYRTLFEQSPDGIIIIDPETSRPLEFNEAAHRQLGYSREEFARLCFADIDAAEVPEDIRSRIVRALREGRSEFENRYRTRLGVIRNLHVTAQIVDIQGHPVYHCIWRDITERLKNERLDRRSQRLEAIGTLAGGMAHDLNNALAPIMLSAELLRTIYPAEVEATDLILTSAQRAADMVRQLLNFAKGAEGERVSLPITQIFDEVAKIVTGTFPKNIQLAVRCDPLLPPVRGDATQLHQVLLNLCVNARDAMPDGGTLTLVAGLAEVDEFFADGQPDIKPGKYVTLQVRDTGTGIAPEIIERIFDPFFTTKAQDKGTGLGLSTVLGIVKGHGGFVKVYSQPGRGSQFKAYLPAGKSESDTERRGRVAVKFCGQGETILFVDDEPAVREMARAVLLRLNYKPMTATGGADGLIRLAEHRHEVRAIVTDMHMPHMDGLAFIQRVRQVLPDIPLVAISGRLEKKEEAELQALKVTLCLDKPFTEAQLADALRGVLAAPKIV